MWCGECWCGMCDYFMLIVIVEFSLGLYEWCVLLLSCSVSVCWLGGSFMLVLVWVLLKCSEWLVVGIMLFFGIGLLLISR